MRVDVTRWADSYRVADDVERAIVEAGLRCVTRWGLAKTTLDDVAREAGVSRATVYRALPGGKGRLVEMVIRYELGRVAHELDATARRADSLEELLCLGFVTGLRLITEHEALRYLVRHEPELVLPHFAFRRLEQLFDHVDEVAGPHLARFLAADEVRSAVELLVRLVLSYSFFPSEAVDVRRPASVRRLVRTYLLPAVEPSAPGPSSSVESSTTSREQL